MPLLKVKSFNSSLFVYLIRDCNGSEVDLPASLSKMHSIIIGPGLGRTESAWEFAKVFYFSEETSVKRIDCLLLECNIDS